MTTQSEGKQRMSDVLIKFPKRRRKARSRPAIAADQSQIYAFPLARNRKLVDTVAREMRRTKSDAGAENVLFERLDERARFFDLHCASRDLDEVEKVLWNLSRAAWAAFDRLADTSQGVA